MLFKQKPQEVLIYDSSWGKNSGEVLIVIEKRGIRTYVLDKVTGRWHELRSSEIATGVIRGVGAGFIVIGLSGMALTLKPVVSSEVGYRVGQITENVTAERAKQEEALKSLEKSVAEREYAAQFAASLGINNTSFSIYIPKIDAKAPILSNIDPSDEKAYAEALKIGVAHAFGSPFPGQDGATYVFAHSTNSPWNVSRYNAVFYLLRELKVEDRDEIYVFFQGKLHKYIIAEKRVVDGTDLTWLNDANSGPERLVLQTCWPPGTTWKRLVVVAYPEPITTSDVTHGIAQPVFGGI